MFFKSNVKSDHVRPLTLRPGSVVGRADSSSAPGWRLSGLFRTLTNKSSRPRRCRTRWSNRWSIWSAVPLLFHFFLRFSRVWMCLDDFRNVLVSLSPKIFKAVAAMQMKLPTLAMFHKSAQGMEPMMCSRGWYRKCLQGCKNCARLCILGHSYQLLCRMCLESARDAMIAGQLIGVRWAKVHDRSSKLCRSRLPSQVKFQRTVGRLLLLPCIDHPKISKTKIISMGL